MRTHPKPIGRSLLFIGMAGLCLYAFCGPVIEKERAQRRGQTGYSPHMKQPRVSVSLQPNASTGRIRLPRRGWSGWTEPSSCIDVTLNERHVLTDCPEGDARDQEKVVSKIQEREGLHSATFRAGDAPVEFMLWSDFSFLPYLRLYGNGKSHRFKITPGVSLRVEAVDAKRVTVSPENGCLIAYCDETSREACSPEKVSYGSKCKSKSIAMAALEYGPVTVKISLD